MHGRITGAGVYGSDDRVWYHSHYGMSLTVPIADSLCIVDAGCTVADARLVPLCVMMCL